MKERTSLYMGFFHAINFLLFLGTFGVSFFTLRIFFQNRFLALNSGIQASLYIGCAILLLISSMIFSSYRTTKEFFVEKEAVVSLISTLMAFILLVFIQLRFSFISYKSQDAATALSKVFTNIANLSSLGIWIIIGIVYFFINKTILDIFTYRNLKRELPLKKTN